MPPVGPPHLWTVSELFRKNGVVIQPTGCRPTIQREWHLIGVQSASWCSQGWLTLRKTSWWLIVCKSQTSAEISLVSICEFGGPRRIGWWVWRSWCQGMTPCYSQPSSCGLHKWLHKYCIKFAVKMSYIASYSLIDSGVRSSIQTIGVSFMSAKAGPWYWVTPLVTTDKHRMFEIDIFTLPEGCVRETDHKTVLNGRSLLGFVFLFSFLAICCGFIRNPWKAITIPIPLYFMETNMICHFAALHGPDKNSASKLWHRGVYPSYLVSPQLRIHNGGHISIAWRLRLTWTFK